jgi:anti-sigma factor RsiW
MKECVDEGTLQAWFDGELRAEAAAAVASHLASCQSCAASAGAIEGENLLLSRALETEFAQPVPTDRIRQRINATIAESQIASPAHTDPKGKPSWWVALGSLLFPSPQRAFGYAGVAAVVILSAIFGLVYFKRNDVVPVAKNEPAKTAATPLVAPSPLIADSGSSTNQNLKPASNDSPRKPAARKPPASSTAPTGLLAGERKYVRTIAALKASIKSKAPLRPSLEVEYEHNVALLDSAIEMTREAVKKNPNDTQAAQFMYSAYQSKVDLLNQVADARRFNTQK